MDTTIYTALGFQDLGFIEVEHRLFEPWDQNVFNVLPFHEVEDVNPKP